MKPLALSLLMGLGGVCAIAAPVTFTIQFAGGAPNPTAGGFTYDSDAVTNPYQSFTVTWNGIVFDLTSPANMVDFGGLSCNTGAADAHDLFSVLSGACGARFWFATNGSPTVPRWDRIVLTSVDGVWRLLREQPTNLPAGAPGFGVVGDFSIAPVAVPEPSSVILMSVGGVLLALRKRHTPRS